MAENANEWAALAAWLAEASDLGYSIVGLTAGEGHASVELEAGIRGRESFTAYGNSVGAAMSEAMVIMRREVAEYNTGVEMRERLMENKPRGAAEEMVFGILRTTMHHIPGPVELARAVREAERRLGVEMLDE